MAIATWQMPGGRLTVPREFRPKELTRYSGFDRVGFACMDVALVRDRVDPRTFKIREALLDRGVSVTEFVRADAYHPMFARYASSAHTRSYRFYYDGWGYEYLLRHLEMVNAASYSRLSRLMRHESYQILHCNSVSEHLAAGLRRWGSLPVVTEVYDVTSLYEVGNLRAHFMRAGRKLVGPRKWVLGHVVRNALRWEKEAHERGSGLVYTSQPMLDYVKQKYAITCPSVVIPNAVYGRLLPTGPRPEKISATQGGLHLVYLGVIRSSAVGHHRDICEQLNAISHGEVVTHLYPVIPDSESARVHSVLDGNENIRWHQPTSYGKLYSELGRFDGGLVLLAPYDTSLLELALPNKIFEYAAAGIPSLVSPYAPLLDFIQRFSCGQPLQSLESVAAYFHPKPVAFRPEYTIEHYVPDLVRLYRQLT